MWQRQVRSTGDNDFETYSKCQLKRALTEPRPVTPGADNDFKN